MGEGGRYVLSNLQCKTLYGGLVQRLNSSIPKSHYNCDDLLLT